MIEPSDLVGLITHEAGAVLEHLASQVPAELAVVELGSHKGLSTAYLATGSKKGNGAPVFAVDPWDLPGNVYGKHGYNQRSVREAFETQLRAARLWSRVTPIQGFSTEIAKTWDGPKVGLLFVDADHAEEAVRADVNAWTPHLAEEHVIVLDDLDTPRNPGVRVVADELAASGYSLEKAADRLAVLTP